MSAGDIVKSTIVPIVGGIVATFMFASPSKAVFKARNRGAIGSLNPLPLVMAMANCVAWTTYGFLTDDWYLIIPNALGCLIATFLFLVSYGLGMPDRRSRDMLSLAFMLLAVLLFVVSIVERMAISSLNTKQKLWGYTGNLILVFYFMAPLSTLLQVLRQQDSSSLVLPLSVMNTVNGLLWGMYGLFALRDPLVWAPNAFGAALGAFQTFLKLRIPSKDNQAPKGGFEDLPRHTNSDISRDVHHQSQKNGGAAAGKNRKHRSTQPEALPHLDAHGSNGHAACTAANSSESVAERIL